MSGIARVEDDIAEERTEQEAPRTSLSVSIRQPGYSRIGIAYPHTAPVDRYSKLIVNAFLILIEFWQLNDPSNLHNQKRGNHP